MKNVALLALVAVATLSLAHAWPSPPREIPMKPPERLVQMATHVVVGTATRVYSTVEREGSFEFTRYLAEVRVESLEKGEGPTKDSPLHVRWFSKRWRGSGPPPADASGQYGWTPKRGDRFRVHVARNTHDGYDVDTDGGYDVLVPNGFVELDER